VDRRTFPSEDGPNDEDNYFLSVPLPVKPPPSAQAAPHLEKISLRVEKAPLAVIPKNEKEIPGVKDAISTAASSALKKVRPNQERTFYKDFLFFRLGNFDDLESGEHLAMTDRFLVARFVLIFYNRYFFSFGCI